MARSVGQKIECREIVRAAARAAVRDMVEDTLDDRVRKHATDNGLRIVGGVTVVITPLVNGSYGYREPLHFENPHAYCYTATAYAE